MKLHEYQAKQLFQEYGIPVPAGEVARSADEARAAAERIGGGRWAVKAQIHAGGRGKGGGVRLAESPEAVGEAAGALLGTRLVTPQTGSGGLAVNAVLVERASRVERELYLGVLVDRAAERVVAMASAAGGMDIEQVAAQTPEKILKVHADPHRGLDAADCAEIGHGLGLATEHAGQTADIIARLYQLFVQCDAGLVEVNPLIVTAEKDLLALDAKVNLDDNALFRHSALAAWRDESQEDPREREAAQHGLSYIALEGDIACMVNGAGLAMATMDLIKLHGGEPANFLDVGGGTTAERVGEAFKLIIAEPQVKSILINIFGGIVRCDLIAEGIIRALREVRVTIPVVVRLEGTNVERGKALLSDSGMEIITAATLTEAAVEAVAAARGGRGP
jgi:succinyl-CoA synthetase beta subunit